MWRAAISAALPAACLPGFWPARPAGRLAVIACGKAAVPMAAEAARYYDGRCSGIVIHPAAEALPRPVAPGLRSYPAGHPLPNRGSVSAARAALDLAASLAPDDLLLVLLSGGGSALMCLPAAGVTLAEKRALTRSLLSCGASIAETNCVRKHLSRIKGGRLAMASAAPVVTLAISDIPGNDGRLIASGPTVPEPTLLNDARAILDRYGITPSRGIARALQAPGNEAPRPDTGAGRNVLRIVASGMTALDAAARFCRENGIEPIVLGDAVEGEARSLARGHARVAVRLAADGAAACLLSGGEATVRLCDRPGAGGRNTEYALALALALDGLQGVYGLAAGTDGIDGIGGHCGATIDPGTLERARRLGLDANDFLERNDSATFFARAGGLMAGRPTGTNVSDFRAILVRPRVLSPP